MKIFISLTVIFFQFVSLTSSQHKNLIYIHGEIAQLVDYNGNLFYELPPGFELINSNIWQGDGKSPIRQGTSYRFKGFPILAKRKTDQKYVLLFEEKEKMVWFPAGLQGVSRLNEGFYLTSTKVNHGFYDSTVFQFFDRNANPVFSSSKFNKAADFSEGLAPVRISGKGWRFINDLGHEYDLLQDSLKDAEWVTSFTGGLSLIKLERREKGKFGLIYPYFINKQGEVVFDIGQMLGGKRIKGVSQFKGGLAAVETEWPVREKYNGFPVTFIDTNGTIIMEINDIMDYKVSETGHVVAMKKNELNKSEAFLYDAKGRLLPIPEGTEHIKYLGGNYFSMHRGLGTGKSEAFLYDVSQQKIIDNHPAGECLGVFGSKLLLKGVNSEMWITDVNTGEEIFHSSLKNIKVINLDTYKGNLEDIEIFYCSKDEWITEIEKMTNLKELTLYNLSIEKFPNIANTKGLRLLRVDGCRKLKNLGQNITNLQQLSLRNCINLEHVKEFVMVQNDLSKLYIINLNITDTEKSLLLNKVPNGTIKGSLEAADYELQEAIYGF